MAITQAMTTSFKKQLLEGGHNFKTSGAGGNAFNIALYTSSASLDASTTGYTAKGNLLVNVTPTTGGTTAFVDFNNTTWSSSTITARGALIFNDTNADSSVAVLDFGSDKSSTSGDFTIQFPTPDATNAIIRIA